MEYREYLKTLTRCPFCFEIEDRFIQKNDQAILTYSLAPYHKHHLLIVPKRHVENLCDLTWEENVSIMALIVTGLNILNKLDHHDCTVLARDTLSHGKSIPHLHYHIIPGGEIVDVSINTISREVLNKSDEDVLLEELKAAL